MKLRIEILPGLIDTSGGGEIVININAKAGSTVVDVLNKIVKVNGQLGPAIFDSTSGKLNGNAAIVVNDRLLEALDGMNTGLNDGDVIRLFPVVAGG